MPGPASRPPKSNVAATAGSGDKVILVAYPASGIAVVTMNRPEARNALSIVLMRELHEIILALGKDPRVAAVVLAANGPVYCSGHDLKELTLHRQDADGGRSFFAATMRLCSELMQAIVRCPKPVIGAVEGIATAAGCQLVATCDLAVASGNASFCTPGVNIGLFCSTPMVALSRNLGRKRAMEMLLLGELISAADAASYGLINRVVPAGRVMEEALSMAARIAEKSPATVAAGKEAFYRQIECSLPEAYDEATRVMVENMMFKDAEEGIGAFLEKRKPDWKGC